MTRTPRIPPELTKKPFSLSEARGAGLTDSALQGKAWRRLGPELYCWQGLRPDPWLHLSALSTLLPSDAVFAGATAAWMWGLDLVPNDPVEIIVAAGSGVRSRSGLTVRRGKVRSSDVVTIRGLHATAVHRTLCDLCVQLAAVNALIAIDMAVHLDLTDAKALRKYSHTVQSRASAQAALAQ